jgi:hypothetical protein
VDVFASMKKYVKTVQGIFTDDQKWRQCKIHSVPFQSDKRNLSLTKCIITGSEAWILLCLLE